MTVAWVFPTGFAKLGMVKQIENLPNTKERFRYATRYLREIYEICELNVEPKSTYDLNNTINTQICL